MAVVTITIPDELDARLQSHLIENGEDLASFTVRVFDEQLSIDEDPHLRAELLEKTRQGMEEIDAGKGIPAQQAIDELATKYGLKLRR